MHRTCPNRKQSHFASTSSQKETVSATIKRPRDPELVGAKNRQTITETFQLSSPPQPIIIARPPFIVCAVVAGIHIHSRAKYVEKRDSVDRDM